MSNDSAYVYIEYRGPNNEPFDNKFVCNVGDNKFVCNVSPGGVLSIRIKIGSVIQYQTIGVGSIKKTGAPND